MAKKSLILSNDDGRVTFTSTGSLSVEDSGAGVNNITASFITASQVTLANIPTAHRILSASNGTFAASSITGSATLNGALVFNGTNWVATNVQPFDYSGSAGGDIRGDYYDDVKIVNITNVNSGTLPANYGGTGISVEPHKRNILKTSGSTISTLSGYASGSILTNTSGAWRVSMPSWKPNVEIYTTPGTYTWKKPSGARFARIVVQGAGGGGANATKDLVTDHVYGLGGGAGGFATDIFDISNLSDATILVGSGGVPTNAFQASNFKVGSKGGDSSFISISSNISISGSGGGGGGRDSTPSRSTAGGVGSGASVIKSGGGSSNNSTISVAYDTPSGGGLGSLSDEATLFNYNYAAPVSKSVNIEGLFGYNYNLISSDIPSPVTGGDGGNPKLVDSSFYDDPYLLLHMKPFYEKKINIESTSSYNPTLVYSHSAGWTGSAPPGFTASSLMPRKYSINNSYNTGSITLTPGYNFTSSAPFTIEGWLYLNSISNSPIIFDTRNGTSATTNFIIQVSSSGRLVFNNSSATPILTSSATVTTNQWQHFALVRTATNGYRFYLTGSADSNIVTSSINLTTATSIVIGNGTVSSTQANSVDGLINNIRLSNSIKYSGSYTVPTTDLPKESDTIFVLNGQEYDNALTTTTADSSYYGRTIRFNNSAALTRSSTAFGDIDYVLYPRSATNSGSIIVDLWRITKSLDTRNFTIEMFIKPISFNDTTTVLLDTKGGGNGSANTFSIGLLSGSNKLFFTTGSTTTTSITSIVTSSIAIQPDSWQHIALVRDNNTASFYINGIKDNSAPVTNNFNSTTTTAIGISSRGTDPRFAFNGFIDEVRVTPKAMYTASFTTSSTRFTDPYNPLLLLHMDHTNNNKYSIIDSSKFNLDIIVDGQTNITNKVGNPFSPYGYSADLSGSTSRIFISDNVFSTQDDDFTIECWAYLTDRSADSVIYHGWYLPGGVDGHAPIVLINSAGRLSIWNGSTYITSNIIVPLNKWTHVAVVKNYTKLLFYIDGILDTKINQYNELISPLIASVGGRADIANQNIKGYVDEFRYSSKALYTGSVITIPTQPFEDPTGQKYTFPGKAKDGKWGSGGGGGGPVVRYRTTLFELSKGWVGGKGGDGYVAIIYW